MRELIALVVLFVGSKMINITASEETDLFSAFGIIISLTALVYLAAAVAERINPKIKKWHRIAPGKPTEMDEEEWKRLENPEEIAALNAKHTAKQKSAPAQTSARAESSPAQTGAPEPPAPRPSAVIYDSGFDETAGREKPKAAGKDEFEDIFGDNDK